MGINSAIDLWLRGRPPRLVQKASLWLPLPGQGVPTDGAQARSKLRWNEAAPDPDLTWGQRVSGRPFMEAVRASVPLREGIRILEIGPGYGRLPEAVLDLQLPFAEYSGLDLSAQNVEYLRGRFAADGRFRFQLADVETWRAADQFDLVISSLTFKHIYPHFGKVLRTCALHLAPGGRVAFDLIEGRRRYFRGDTYIRWYTRPQVRALATKAGLAVERFVDVDHTARHRRLLVVCRSEGEP